MSPLRVCLTLTLALAAALPATHAAAAPNPALRRQCRELCAPYRPLCMATNRRGKERLYRLCWKNLTQSCRLSAAQTFPPEPTCTFPCTTDGDCGFGRSCREGQCIIPPLFSRPGPDCSCRCDDNSVCTVHADCGVDSLGIPNICGCPLSPPCDGHGGTR